MCVCVISSADIYLFSIRAAAENAKIIAQCFYDERNICSVFSLSLSLSGSLSVSALLLPLFFEIVRSAVVAVIIVVVVVVVIAILDRVCSDAILMSW